MVELNSINILQLLTLPRIIYLFVQSGKKICLRWHREYPRQVTCPPIVQYANCPLSAATAAASPGAVCTQAVLPSHLVCTGQLIYLPVLNPHLRYQYSHREPKCNDHKVFTGQCLQILGNDLHLFKRTKLPTQAL